MGILNVTPDSFYDGGSFPEVNMAIERTLQMIEQGADIIDIGGESTRPGSDRISVDEELHRVIPVIEGIIKHNPRAVISIDTYKSQVADEAAERGAAIINDISGLRFDEAMADVARKHDISVIVMHMKGEPKTMQESPVYGDVVAEVKTFLQERVNFARENGIAQIIIDPGIGFGKRIQDNLEILRSLKEFTEIHCPVLIGLSRKSFIGNILNTSVEDRLEGSLAAAAIAIINGAGIIRTHDILATKHAVQLAFAISFGSDYTENKFESMQWK